MRRTNKTTVRNFWRLGLLVLVGLPLAALMVTGCDPTNFVARNACDFLNCDTLPFVDEIFPLSAGPTMASDGGGGGAMVMPEEKEEEGGGHMH